MKRLLFITLSFCFLWQYVHSQKSYEMEVMNLVQYNETEYRFDVRMRNTSPDPSGAGAFAIDGIQWQLLYNTSLLNGGALNNNFLTYVPNTTDLVGTAIIPASSNFTTNQVIMQWITSPLGLYAETTLFNDANWKRIGTFKVVLRNQSTNPGSLAKNWGDGLLNLIFNGSSNVIVTECNYFEEEGVYYRADAYWAVVPGQTLTNSVSNKPIFSRCFTGTGNYSDPLRWNNAVAASDPSYHVVPTASSNNISIGGYTSTGVISAGTCTLTDNRTVNDLTIKSTSMLTINPSVHLTVNGNLYKDNGSNSALYLKSDASGSASLIHNNTGVQATVERYIAGHNNDEYKGWHFLSSPVAAQPISAFHEPNGIDDFYKWDEEVLDSKKWINRTAATVPPSLNEDFEVNFTPGRGYLVAFRESSTKTFSGTLNVGNYPYTGLTYTSGTYYPGWHLLGNPYASALKFNQGSWNRTNVSSIAQIWKEATASYKVLRTAMEIPAMNGFMVYTNTGDGSITIPADARIHSDSNWYKQAQSFEGIVLVADDPEGGTSQETMIRFDPQSTEGYDFDLDSYYLAGFAPAFYSKSLGKNYALNTLPAFDLSMVIPLGFVKNSLSLFSIRLDRNISGVRPILRDLKLNIDQDLSVNPAYHFSSENGDNANRFELRFASVGMAEMAMQPVAIYSNGKTITIESRSGIAIQGQVIVYNLLGQEIKNQPLANGPVTTLNVDVHHSGLIVKVQLDQQIYSGKVFIQ